ncbi:hypothetical protein A3D03_05830 [Candidatus Gottesmanbacteria bacterium RIFCSPHIGHO2_02_FULL_40_13]|uniref:alanine--tRNA ligase n=1 Tax=Candidatus Gottesmanbacteria bacterium RIFCSPHIGHO2_02_FULL_40_13 TaxID=1798384 RepID=A0A1F6A8Q8_9BACT|nr:MAG: hypothetical protein A3D03_05830 [Candidatus Gottesmanbacteria bacterium RIFCSPHIGHO2_02_FULL_40_13]
MTHRELRKKYLDFFLESPRNHQVIPSAPIIPENDPTTLFTSSGMQPLIPFLLGEKHPLGQRLTDSQKSFRAQDINEVGDNRHSTFFEMLGNWSLGDYFKNDQLRWFFTFLTKVLKLDPNKLYVTVYEGDQIVPKDTESVEIWKEIYASVGIDAKVVDSPSSNSGTSAKQGRIFLYPASKNWWSRSGEPEKMPPGEPGGPDSEVFFEFTQIPHDPKFGKQCHPNCECGHFLEIGNSVFMQYQKQADGTLTELPNKNVDFGGGLERLIAATENNPDIFQSDLFFPVIELLSRLSGKKYSDPINQPPMRIITDHLKAATFMLAEGLQPGNKQQGYILRRLIRRSVVKMHKLHLQCSTIEAGIQICQVIGQIYSNVYLYPETKEFSNITSTLSEEIKRFEQVLNKGIKLLEKQPVVDGKLAFDLLQTYGFPWELTAELALERGQKIDFGEFQKEFQKHQELSRNTSKGMFKGGLQNHSEVITRLHTATHLLQQTLRDILGDHVRQKGSNITVQRLRFDFTHPKKLTDQEILDIEKIVNLKIKENLRVNMSITELEQALKNSALTVPGVKYPAKVKVYSIGNFSKEVCGGPHVDFTGLLGKFKIIKEEAAGSNSRRIYATLI